MNTASRNHRHYHLVLLFLGIILNRVAFPAPQDLPERSAVCKSDIDHWMTQLSNWGRWGKEDQLGALNLVSASKARTATRLVREGVSVSLAHEAVTERAADNPLPFLHRMDKSGMDSDSGASDTYSVTYHGLVQ